MTALRLGSLFDGIGVFPLAAVRCGIEPIWASEIEKAPISITKRHFPDMAHLGDVTKLDGRDLPPVHTAIREDMQTAANRMKAITTIQNAVADCEKHKAVHDKYIKIGWKIRKEAYAESHKDELTAFNKAYRTLKKHGGDLNVDLKALQKEYDDLKISHTNLKAQLAAVNEELKPMKDIRYWVGKVLSPEQTATKQPEPKHSLKERLLYEQEQKKQVQKAPKQKKQDMEL